MNIAAEPPTPTICIVDDDPSILCSLQRLLASDGLSAQTFDSPEAFLDYARNQDVRLALLDVLMAQMNGIELQRQLREFSPQTRTIMMTGRDGPAIRVAALQGGALMLLVKPFNDGELLATVHSILH